ncbi:unnamed protein product [Cuscuta epithymum]|uniref:Uncharacterized protein n=1 Tax=Cuscuta epithymum TaxID=186058 RepID=A0AAV0EIS5_9ASTE|nr:unnamed protein product [Cuscuta epithymum]
MDDTINYHYLCYHCECIVSSSSPHRGTSCPRCLSRLIYEIQSITFYIKDIGNHQMAPVRWHGRPKSDGEIESYLMTKRAGVVIRLRWNKKGVAPPTNRWKGPGQLQSAVEQVTKCNQWYWCYDCQRRGTLDLSAIISSSRDSEVICCRENLFHRAIRFTDATIDNQDHFYWCYQCHRPHVIISSTSSSSSESICPQCQSDQFMSIIHIRRTWVVFGDLELHHSWIYSRTYVLLNSSWFVQLSPSERAWLEQHQTKLLSSSQAAAGKQLIGDMVLRITEEEKIAKLQCNLRGELPLAVKCFRWLLLLMPLLLIGLLVKCRKN